MIQANEKATPPAIASNILVLLTIFSQKNLKKFSKSKLHMFSTIFLCVLNDFKNKLYKNVENRLEVSTCYSKFECLEDSLNSPNQATKCGDVATWPACYIIVHLLGHVVSTYIFLSRVVHFLIYYQVKYTHQIFMLSHPEASSTHGNKQPNSNSAFHSFVGSLGKAREVSESASCLMK